ncbi:TetR/AcrR family transcriptional regulator [Streptomyces sp. NPDC053780]|uniref:TetR/AcrR family transcriptional regulator n=1 Tax=unclassified Streptomyces TaxID=2593676 RepID=UPI00341CFA0C
MSNIEFTASDPVREELVQAALRAARARDVAVGDVSMQAIAQEAGISRSTLLRRLGGNRHALDEAVRAAGVDPGGQRPVRERALEAGAALIGERGLSALSFERVAAQAQCSVHSLYAAFGGRDEMLLAVFERYSPILDVEAVLAAPSADLRSTVRTVYSLMAAALSREPRLLPAVYAEVLARPHDDSVRPITEQFIPRMFASVGRWLTAEIEAGRIRDLPLLLLMQQMTSPLMIHFLMRPTTDRLPHYSVPPVEDVCETFADAFLRAVTPPRDEPPRA